MRLWFISLCLSFITNTVSAEGSTGNTLSPPVARAWSRAKSSCARYLSGLNFSAARRRRFARKMWEHNARLFWFEDQRIKEGLIEHHHPREKELVARAAEDGFVYRVLGVNRELYVHGEGLVAVGWGSAVLVDPRTNLVRMIVVQNIHF